MAVGVMARAALISAIYRRSMVLSGKARQTITNGRLVNHISTDISRIDFAAGFAHMAWTSPIQLAVVMAILLVNLGYSALPGIAFLLFMTPAQGWTMKRMFLFRRRGMRFTDQRAKLIQELLGGIKVLKFFGASPPSSWVTS